jgi:hypothetical protein
MDSADLRHLHRGSEVSRDIVNRIVVPLLTMVRLFKAFQIFWYTDRVKYLVTGTEIG